jgi:peptide/nickel transport system substrate-binding protein
LRPGRLIAASVVSLGLVAAACGGDNSSSTATTAGGSATTAASGSGTTAAGSGTTAAGSLTTEKPVDGGKITVRVEAEVGNPWAPANLNCDTACETRARTFYEPLMALDGTDQSIKPYLLTSCTPDADFKVWTMKVRPGITFSDGTPLNADVVVDNLQRGLKSPLLAPIFTTVTGVAKVDDMTVTVTSSSTWVDLCSYYASSIGYMASSKWLAAVDADPTQATKPIGTGPFILTDFVAGQQTIVKKNPNYWRKSEDLPHLDEIDFRIISDELTAANALKAGQIDVLTTLNGQNIKDFKADSKYNYSAQDKYTDTIYQMLNVGQQGSPLADQNVRCGLTAATDTKTLVDTQTAGQFKVANGPFSPGQQGYLDDPGNQKYDPAKAKQLIKTWSDAHGGQKPKIIISTTTDSTAQQGGQLLQQWWNDAGADVSVQAVEQSKLITNALVGDPSFNAFSWRNHAGNYFEYQTVWWSSANAQPPGQVALNFGRMKDPVIDQALQTARTSPDPAAQVKAAEDANREFAKQCWMIPDYWNQWATFSTKKVHGIGNSATLPDGKTLRGDGEGKSGQIQLSGVWVTP